MNKKIYNKYFSSKERKANYMHLSFQPVYNIDACSYYYLVYFAFELTILLNIYNDE